MDSRKMLPVVSHVDFLVSLDHVNMVVQPYVMVDLLFIHTPIINYCVTQCQ